MGVQQNHPDLYANIAPATSECFTNAANQQECINSAPSGEWHGTLTAGVMAAKGNNGKGIAGVVWDAYLYSAFSLDVKYIGCYKSLLYNPNDPIQFPNLCIQPGQSVYIPTIGSSEVLVSISDMLNQMKLAAGLLDGDPANNRVVVNNSWGAPAPCYSTGSPSVAANRYCTAGFGAVCSPTCFNLLDFQPITDMFNTSSGTLWVFAAGNDNTSLLSYPQLLGSLLDNVLSVGASDNNDVAISYTSRYVLPTVGTLGGPSLQIWAPSADTGPCMDHKFILTLNRNNGGTPTDVTGLLNCQSTAERTWFQSEYIDNFNTATTGTYPEGIYYTYGATGTSMAAPQVAGVAALVHSLQPMTAKKLKPLLLSTADPVVTGIGVSGIGNLRVNARKAVEAALAIPASRGFSASVSASHPSSYPLLNAQNPTDTFVTITNTSSLRAADIHVTPGYGVTAAKDRVILAAGQTNPYELLIQLNPNNIGPGSSRSCDRRGTVQFTDPHPDFAKRQVNVDFVCDGVCCASGECLPEGSTCPEVPCLAIPGYDECCVHSDCPKPPHDYNTYCSNRECVVEEDCDIYWSNGWCCHCDDCNTARIGQPQSPWGILYSTSLTLLWLGIFLWAPRFVIRKYLHIGGENEGK